MPMLTLDGVPVIEIDDMTAEHLKSFSKQRPGRVSEMNVQCQPIRKWMARDPRSVTDHVDPRRGIPFDVGLRWEVNFTAQFSEMKR